HFIDEYLEICVRTIPIGVHVDFFRTVSPFLKPGGIIILLENNAGSTVEAFRSKIENADWILCSHVVICHSAHETTNTISLESCGPVTPRLVWLGNQGTGIQRVRHQGKVSGLAAMGEPARGAELMARYRVDDEGRVHSDLGGDRAIYAFMRAFKPRNHAR